MKYPSPLANEDIVRSRNPGRGIKDSLVGHTIRTAYEQGWSTLLNGELLSAAENAGFEVLLTTDKNLVYQQNLIGRKIAIVAPGKNRWSLIQPVLPKIAEAIRTAKPGSFALVEIPEQ